MTYIIQQLSYFDQASHGMHQEWYKWNETSVTQSTLPSLHDT